MTPGPGIARTQLPKGFTASGVNSGVRKYRPDLGIILSDRESVAVAVFTLNECKAAPVLYSQNLVPSAHMRGIITNSGQANAATGEDGRDRNWQMALAAAKSAGCLPHQILTASTGMIGIDLAVEKIVEAMPELINRASDTAESFANAILTTDLVPKAVTTTVALSGGTVRITGISKGSGMIHPNMATMLGYLLTDAELELGSATQLLRDVNNVSFNMISVDGDTSTNDTVFLMANGASGVALTTAEDRAAFKKALTEVSQVLAQAIARDGEGANKMIQVELRGAPTVELARAAARGITISPLIKSAIHGEDPNWGRILARLGAEKIPASALDRMTLQMQDTVLFADGKPVVFDRNQVRQQLKADTVYIRIELSSGPGNATAWGCDLSKRYVDINAEYST